MSKFKISKLDNTKFKVHIKASDDERIEAEKQALEKINKIKKIPGFRKGKAPKHIIKSKFQNELTKELLHIMMNIKLPEINAESDYQVFDIVGIENFDFNEKNLSFDLTYNCMPYLKIDGLKEIKMYKHIANIEDKDITNELKSIQRNFAEFKEKENKIAEKGDLITLDFEFWLNDVPSGEPLRNQKYFLGDDHTHLDEEIEREILDKNKKTGDEIIVKKKVTEAGSNNDANKDQKKDIEKDYQIIVEIKDIQKVIEPEINNDFVKKFNPKLNSVDELKEDIKLKLEKGFRHRNLDFEILKALASIKKSSKFYYSDSYVENKIELFLEDHNIKRKNLPSDNLLKVKTEVQEKIKNDLLMQHFFKEAAALDKEKKSYDEKFYDFLKHETDEENAQLIFNLFANIAQNKGVSDEIKITLEQYIKLYHIDIIFSYFQKLDLVKKGQKFSFRQLIDNYK